MTERKLTYFISGGGTGGHIYPAISVMERLLDDKDTENIYFIGNPKNLEYEILKAYPKVTFLPVNVSAMPRKVSFAFLSWIFKLEIALWKTLFYSLKYKPNVNFTTGGYVSAPVAFITTLTKVPLMIHDCDAQPGLVSKYAAPLAKIVSVAFENSKKLLNSTDIVYNGNPIRKAFLTETKQSSLEKLGLNENKKTILVMGGSQGAKTINSAIVQIAETLLNNYNVQLIIQTGKKNYDDVIKEFKNVYPDFERNGNLIVRPYFDEMFIPLKAADIVVSRAGSVSLSEICLSESASILIPYPHAAQDHQRKNAREMVEKGASLYLEDSECNAQSLLSSILELLNNSSKLEEMSKSASTLAPKDAAEKIVEQLKSIAK